MTEQPAMKSPQSVYGKHFYLNGDPVTVVREIYDRIWFVHGHHDMGDMRSDDSSRNGAVPMPNYFPDELAGFTPTHRFWCPCFLAWQPATAETETCPAYGCTPALLIREEAS